MRVPFGLHLVSWVLIPLACASAAANPPRPFAIKSAADPTEMPDTALFSAVIRAIPRIPRPVFVDPVPLRADPRIIAPTESSARASVSEDVLQARRAVLARFGIPEANAFTYASCPGVLVPPPPTGSRSGHCPKQEMEIYLVALPREGGAYFPESGVDERESGRKLGQVTVRVIQRSVGPQAGSYSAWDYVAQRRHGEWVIVKREVHAFVD